MGCCGKNRAMVRPVENHDLPRVKFTPRAPSVQYFEYVGPTSITAFGPVTGRRYRFAGPGAILEVDGRDAPSIAGVPNLYKARSPE